MLNKGNPKIRVAISDPKLQDKITINLAGGNLDAIYWFIRFNIPLDESSVNEDSMEVTDTDGYVMRTDITYQAAHNRIAISPLDSYEEQRYYVLKVSTKVRSAKGQHLKTEINILFQLYQGKISEYKILQKDVPVPQSRPRPLNYDDRQNSRESNDLDNYTKIVKTHTRMTPENVGFNPILAVLGFILVIIGFTTSSVPVIITAVVVCILGALHISAQWQNKNFRAKMYYNRGVRYFNKLQYSHAKTAFEKALYLNPNNELAKYGLVRVGLYK